MNTCLKFPFVLLIFIFTFSTYANICSRCGCQYDEPKIQPPPPISVSICPKCTLPPLGVVGEKEWRKEWEKEQSKKLARGVAPMVAASKGKGKTAVATGAIALIASGTAVSSEHPLLGGFLIIIGIIILICLLIWIVRNLVKN